MSKRFGFWPHITHVIVLTFKEIKHLSDYRTVGLSDYQTVGLSDCRIIGRTPFPIFKLCGENLQIEDSYSYLGVIFNYNGSFVKARAKLMDQAHKALYCLNRKLRNISIPIDLQLKLFDTLILPIIT